METLNDIIFYHLDKAIRLYKQYAHQQLAANNFDLTVDQWLVLKALDQNPDSSQQEIAEMTFKDYASLTRIIELLVQKKYLERAMHKEDRRRFRLTLTPYAHQVLKRMQPVIENNRSVALKGLSKKSIGEAQAVLEVIIRNCSRSEKLVPAL